MTTRINYNLKNCLFYHSISFISFFLSVLVSIYILHFRSFFLDKVFFLSNWMDVLPTFSFFFFPSYLHFFIQFLTFFFLNCFIHLIPFFSLVFFLSFIHSFFLSHSFIFFFSSFQKCAKHIIPISSHANVSLKCDYRFEKVWISVGDFRDCLVNNHNELQKKN